MGRTDPNSQSNKIGWILVHSQREYGDGEDYPDPKSELKNYYEPGVPWHWRCSRPLREGGPYTVLFAWKGEVFGEAEACVTQKITEKGFNFAFTLNHYRERKLVPFSKLPLGTRRRHHRSLIRLDDKVLSKYRKLR